METAALPRSRRPAGNTATVWLKIIALAFMFTDHAGKMLFPAVPEMRILGRIAFPVYVWCMIVGFHYTRSVPKYLLRVLLVGLISQPLYIIALNHTWQEPNVFLTLFLGLCALWGVREKKFLSHLWAPAAALILASLLKADYGWKGVLVIFCMYLFRKREWLRAITAGPVLLFSGWIEAASWPDFVLFHFYNGQRGRQPKYFFYVFYPAHLALLVLVRYLAAGLWTLY